MISWVLLTHNRSEIVSEAFGHCLRNAGAPWKEIIWVDNGSDFDHYARLQALFRPYVHTAVSYHHNRGVAAGYNAGMGLATGDYIVVTGCDMKMPANWLALFIEYVTKIPQTAVACIYSKPLSKSTERIRGPAQIVNGLPLVPAFPIERRIFKRELLRDIGYFWETFGLYSYDDIAWAHTAERVAMEKGLINYVIPNVVAEHLGTEGIHKNVNEDPAYHAMKQREATDPAKRAELERLRGLGWPAYRAFL